MLLSTTLLSRQGCASERDGDKIRAWQIYRKDSINEASERDGNNLGRSCYSQGKQSPLTAVVLVARSQPILEAGYLVEMAHHNCVCADVHFLNVCGNNAKMRSRWFCCGCALLFANL
jgi:hypothetical protein